MSGHDAQLLEELPGGFEFRPTGGLMYLTTPDQGAMFEEFVAERVETAISGR